MPFTVITLKKVPPSLRGDLTKWLQEIATGVYIGNINPKVRENLWSRIKENVLSGEATISYASRNELGYQFDMINTLRCSVDLDGMSLVMVPHQEIEKESLQEGGFSSSSKIHKTNRFNSVPGKRNISFEGSTGYVIIDLETNGLDPASSEILEIGAVKQGTEGIMEFSCLVNCYRQIQPYIQKLTGISEDMLFEEGIALEDALEQLLLFIEDNTVIGYNVSFDMEFLNYNMKKLKKSRLQNKTVDLMKIVKDKKIELGNYKLETVLKECGIADKVPHRALEDARLILALAKKLKII